MVMLSVWVPTASPAGSTLTVIVAGSVIEPLPLAGESVTHGGAVAVQLLVPVNANPTVCAATGWPTKAPKYRRLRVTSKVAPASITVSLTGSVITALSGA